LWLPATAALFALACRRLPAAAPGVLVGASLLFCAAAGPRSLIFLVLSILGNFGAMEVIRRMTPGSSARRWVVVAAVLANLAPLVGFKLAQQVLPVVLPLGLAFYTLQQITFLIDGQKPGAERLGLLRFAAWGSFFGQLPAGPIGAWPRMAPQFAQLGRRPPAAADVARGVALVLAGVVKKTWLADPMARKVDAVLSAADLGAVTPLEAWTAAWGFMLQLYLDFSAYSDIAIGVGLCFGLLLPMNFNSPLKAATPGQYVMRWHMTLMTFVRDYVFEPVFRLARKLPIGPTSRRYGVAWGIATLVAYLAVAAWHTTAPLPLFQGLCVALLIILLQFARQSGRSAPRTIGAAERIARRIAGQALILLGVAVIALLLRAEGEQLGRLMPALTDVNAALRLGEVVGRSLFAGAGSSLPDLYPNARLPGLRTLAMIWLVTTIVLTCPNTMQIFGMARADGVTAWIRWRPTLLWGFLTVVLLTLALIGVTRPVEQYGFIYARF
jgi:D-alanyl-lipoteichoic acid acyltransferase DltB (MBOAT superfamily)